MRGLVGGARSLDVHPTYSLVPPWFPGSYPPQGEDSLFLHAPTVMMFQETSDLTL